MEMERSVVMAGAAMKEGGVTCIAHYCLSSVLSFLHFKCQMNENNAGQ